MFRKNVYTFKTLPVEEKQRIWTDYICTILTALFALILFVLSFVLFQKANYTRTNFPANDSGVVCVLDSPSTPLLFFTKVTDITSGRVCVASCPANGSIVSTPSGPIISTYSTYADSNRVGPFCQPADPAVANTLWSNPGFSLQQKELQLNGYTVMVLSFILGVCLGIAYFAATMCCARPMTVAVFVTAALALLSLGVLLVISPMTSFASPACLVIGVALIIGAILLFIYLICYRRQIDLASIFLQNSATCLRENPSILWVLPLFVLCNLGLLVLCIWQFIAFGSTGDATYTPGNLFYNSKPNMLLEVLNVIEFIWGIHFLRDAMNFIVSGYEVEWYFKANSHNPLKCTRPFKLLFTRNWGSVAGGSFLSAFFGVFDIIYDFFRCDPQGSCGKGFSIYSKLCCCCDSLFELIRSDAYAYINLTGIPYCDSARQCEALCANSRLFYSHQSCLRLYRLAGNVLLVSLLVIIAYLTLLGKVSATTGTILVLVATVSYLAIGPFVNIVADGAEGLQVCYLAENNCEGEEMRVCPAQLNYDIHNFELKNHLSQ